MWDFSGLFKSGCRSAEYGNVYPGGTSGKEPACQCRRHKRHKFNSWNGKITWRNAWQPTPVFLPGEPCGLRSLVGYCPKGCKESDTTAQVTHTCCYFYFFSNDYWNYIIFYWRRQWHPTPVLLPGKSHGQRSLEGCSPWGHWGSGMSERLHLHFSLSCTGEENGNPLQCSCLENPRDGGAWWAAVYGVTESDTTEVT